MAVAAPPKITSVTIGGKLHFALFEEQESRVPDRSFVPAESWSYILKRIGIEELDRWACVPTGLRVVNAELLGPSTWQMSCQCGIRTLERYRPGAEMDRDRNFPNVVYRVGLEPFEVRHPGNQPGKAIMVVGQCGRCRRIYWGQLEGTNNKVAFLLESEYIGMREVILSRTLRRLE